MSRAVGSALAALIVANCATLQPAKISPGFASNPADRYGWRAPLMGIQGHPMRPANSLVRVSAKF